MEKKIMVTRVGAGSIGRLVGTVNAIFAAAMGIVGSFVAISNVIATDGYSFLANVGVSAAIVMFGIIVLPLLAFGFGWLYGGLIGVIWNVLLGTTGGLEVGVENVEEPLKK